MERWAYEYFRRQAIEDRCKQEAQWLIEITLRTVSVKWLENFV